MRIRIISIICFVFVCLSLDAQNWPKIYGNSTHFISRKVINNYDNGYIIGGFIYDPLYFVKYSWIIKTDINGNILWEKKIGNGNDQFAVHDIEECSDKGLILIGGTTKYDTDFDPMVIKMNYCGEIEWCKVFHSMDTYNTGIRILSLESGYLALIKYHGYDISNKRIFLFRLDETGEILWQNVYAQNDPLIWNEEGYGLLQTSDNNFIITGACQYPTISGGDTSTYKSDRPYFIYVDSLGNEIWDLKWGIEQYSFGLSWQSIEKSPGIFYSACGYATEGIPPYPVLFKYDILGNQLYQKYLIDEPDLVGGGAETFEVYNDTNLIIAYHWRNTHIPVDYGYSMIMKTDTMGNVISDRLLMEKNRAPEDVEITHDNKILVLGSYVLDSNWDTFLWKMNENLEDDSLYTGQYTYDSLCPDPIVSDTMDCNCTVVSLEEIIKNSNDMFSWIYPNPAKERINLRLHQWKENKEKRFVLYSIQGIEILIKEIPDYIQSTSVELPDLTSGLYIAVLYSGNEVLEREKMMVGTR